jgi:hypothetical protein
MMNNMSGLIDKLKKGAVDRCRERIIEAREKPKDKAAMGENTRNNHGFTSSLKKMRGL